MNIKLFLLSIILSFALLLTSCVSVQVKDNTVSTISSEVKKPKNIILLIGDGMGLSQVSTAIYYKDGKPNFERFSTIGLIKTSSASDLVTDSAAGATVFSAGVKTYNGAIGVDKDTIPVPTIIEQLSKRGLATGIISTSSIQHATPASFYAHVKSRRMYEEITEFAPNSGVNFFAGGGLKFFNKRKDGKDLLAEMRAKGYEVIIDQLPKTPSEKHELILLAEDAMPKMSEGRGDFLPNATKLALEKLSKNEKGFFLMVEGSQIDWGGHNNDADYLIKELLDFDKTLGVALDFAKQNGETLVIVTADHETGGYSLSSDGSDYNKIKPSFSTTGHSGTMVPVFSEGPGASSFNGIFESIEIYHKMMALFNK
ncbi:alkaline phosphatase [Aequorivita lipolytica]|uniref:Alkaline phosphatase n=1 Tax=Aequorivita lipolytica TaxID=153267 RepID=A0A5C6YR02_9FLAO|nr:alkaline phosphatase [Aequorivita lipolytica]TXD69941.1 alkaline phosphatase [Aequorivita lipolytica]SRX50235.1 Alkaline phosphatase 3 [Aequorivita lipolytica]